MERRDSDMINVWGMTDIGLVRTENQDAYVKLRDELKEKKKNNTIL